MKSSKLTLLFAGLCLAQSSVLLAAPHGGMDSGGGDMRSPDYHSAWFIGDRPIKYCIQSAPGFPIPMAQAISEIEDAFTKWRTYIVERRSSETTTALILNREYIPNCDGTQDLKFYLGTTDAEVEKAAKLHTNPIAFSFRGNFDPESNWGSGFIWVSPSFSIDSTFPDWSQPHAFGAIILHEIGHVLGCEHVKGTIMDERIGERIREMGLSWMNLDLTQIDSLRVLTGCKYCTMKWEGQLSNNSNDGHARENFVRLMGRQPNGTMHAWLQASKEANTLVISDAAGRREFPLEPEAHQDEHHSTRWDVIKYETGTPIFKIARYSSSPEAGRGWDSTYSTDAASVLFSNIVAFDGTRYFVVGEFNTNNAPIELSYVLNGKRTVIFHTDKQAVIIRAD